MRDLLIGVAIAYLGFSPSGQKLVEKMKRELAERYLMSKSQSQKQEGKENEKPA